MANFLSIFKQKNEPRERCKGFQNGAKECICRSRRELSNEYLLAKFGFDTAENEPVQEAARTGGAPGAAGSFEPCGEACEDGDLRPRGLLL